MRDPDICERVANERIAAVALLGRINDSRQLVGARVEPAEGDSESQSDTGATLLALKILADQVNRTGDDSLLALLVPHRPGELECARYAIGSVDQPPVLVPAYIQIRVCGAASVEIWSVALAALPENVQKARASDRVVELLRGRAQPLHIRVVQLPYSWRELRLAGDPDRRESAITISTLGLGHQHVAKSEDERSVGFFLPLGNRAPERGLDGQPTVGAVQGPGEGVPESPDRSFRGLD